MGGGSTTRRRCRNHRRRTVFTLKTFTTIGPITGLTLLTIPPT